MVNRVQSAAAESQTRIRAASSEFLKRQNALNFISNYMKYMKPTDIRAFEYAPAKHHDLIIAEFEKMLSGVVAKFAASLPPGSAKSTYGSVILPTLILAREPRAQVLCVSNTESLAEGFSRQRRAILQTEEWQRLSGTELASDAQSLGFQGTVEGGGIYCAGAGSSVTGLRCDWLICDDLLVGFEQANNIVQLDKLWNWYLAEARSRLKPYGREIMLATRWAALDPIGRVMDLAEQNIEHWEYLRIPMEADSPDDPLGREMGDRLWKEWYTEEMVSDAKRDSMVWQTLYQQSPVVAEGAWVDPENIKIVPAHELPSNLKYYIGVDIALSIQKGDYTVFAVLGLDANKNLYLIDLYREQVSPEVSASKLVELTNQYKPLLVYCENDNSSKVWSRLVWEISKKEGVPVPLKLIPIGGRDKEVRAAPLRAYFLQSRVFIKQAPWNTELLRELSSFPAGRHDDQIDAIGVAAGELVKMSAPKKPQAPNPYLVDTQQSYGSLAKLFEERDQSTASLHRRRG